MPLTLSSFSFFKGRDDDKINGSLSVQSFQNSHLKSNQNVPSSPPQGGFPSNSYATTTRINCSSVPEEPSDEFGGPHAVAAREKVDRKKLIILYWSSAQYSLMVIHNVFPLRTISCYEITVRNI